MSTYKQYEYQHVDELTEDNASIEELINVLSNQFPIPNEQNITHISKEDITFFSKLLRCYSELEVWSKEIENCVQAVFKALRNSMAYNESGQNLIHQDGSILSSINDLWNKISTSESILQLCLKFLTNLVVRNERSAANVWTHLEKPILNLLGGSICSEMAITLYYNILLLKPPDLYVNLDTLHCVLALNEIKEFEMIADCLKNLLLTHNMLLCYDSVKKEYSIVILRAILDAIAAKFILTIVQIKFVADMFKARWEHLVSYYIQPVNKTSDIEALEVIHLADILATLTSSEEYLIVLQEDRDLFMDTIFLLKSIHETGKLCQNLFTPSDKLGDERGTSAQGVDELVGFKSTLIRIIGNLCNKHTINQDEIRGVDGISLILDCCKIDSKNPFIMQWAIYAIRNICLNNQENQNHISSMTMKSGCFKTLMGLGIE